jgi:hypothetical protein
VGDLLMIRGKGSVREVCMPKSDPIAGRPVNIYVSKEIAFDIDKMSKITKSILGRLGCEGCHSGRLLLYHTLEDFVVNPRTLEVEELGGIGFGR